MTNRQRAMRARPAPRLRRRPAAGRAPSPSTAPRERRPWGWILLALAGWIIALALLFRAEPAPPAEPIALADPTPSRVEAAPPARAPTPRRPAAPAQEVDRAKLLALIEERSPSLQKCGGAAPLRLLTRMTLGRTGEVRAVSFSSSDAPVQVTTCVRSELESWQLAGVKLKREIEVLIALSLGGGAPARSGGPN